MGQILVRTVVDLFRCQFSQILLKADVNYHEEPKKGEVLIWRHWQSATIFGIGETICNAAEKKKIVASFTENLVANISVM